VEAMGLGHQSPTGLVMSDVVRRLVERGAPQLVMAACRRRSADDSCLCLPPLLPALGRSVLPRSGLGRRCATSLPSAI